MTCQIDRLVEAIFGGADALAVNTKLKELEARQAALTDKLGGTPDAEPLLHPALATIYRDKVASSDTRCEHRARVKRRSSCRALIDSVQLVPVGNDLEIELLGFGRLLAVSETALHWAGTRWRTRPCKSRWLRGHATSGAVTPSQPRPVHCYGLEGASGAQAQAQAAAETRSQEVASERSETPKINLAKLQTPSHDGSDEKTYRTPSFPVSNPRGFIDATTCPGSVLRCQFRRQSGAALSVRAPARYVINVRLTYRPAQRRLKAIPEGARCRPHGICRKDEMH